MTRNRPRSAYYPVKMNIKYSSNVYPIKETTRYLKKQVGDLE